MVYNASCCGDVGMSEDDSERVRISRRTVLQASGSAVALPVFGANQVSADGANGAGEVHAAFERCPDATIRPSMGHCEGASMEGCADDHHVTIELREAVQQTLEREYPDAGALLDAGFKPYFDTLDVADEDGWSHWLNPEFIGDDDVLDPERPESVLVDNSSWRSIGVMFIATRDGEAVEPPVVYDDGGAGRDDEREDNDHEAHHGDGNGWVIVTVTGMDTSTSTGTGTNTSTSTGTGTGTSTAMMSTGTTTTDTTNMTNTGTKTTPTAHPGTTTPDSPVASRGGSTSRPTKTSSPTTGNPFPVAHPA